MEIKGKKINFLGDSITEGAGASAPQFAYHQVMKTIYGIKEARNYGIGGTRFARQKTPSVSERFDLDFCMRAEEMDKDADIVVVFGGTNDYGHGDAPLGNFEDRDEYTFSGACHVLMRKLKELYPEAEIVIVTPMHRENENNPCGDAKPEPVGTLKEYVDIIRKTAEYYALPVCDIFAMGRVMPDIPVMKEKYTTDGLHPNDAGHRLLAERIGNFLKNL